MSDTGREDSFAVQVIASYGHVRDLPPKAGSVNPERDFDMRWQVQPSAHLRLADIAGNLTSAKALVLATDPDREGEAISWHLQQELQVSHRDQTFTVPATLLSTSRTEHHCQEVLECFSRICSEEER